MNLKTNKMKNNNITECKCGKSSIELEAVAEDCFIVKYKNTTWYDSNSLTFFKRNILKR